MTPPDRPWQPLTLLLLVLGLAGCVETSATRDDFAPLPSLAPLVGVYRNRGEAPECGVRPDVTEPVALAGRCQLAARTD